MMTTETIKSTTTSDRSLSAFLKARGHDPHYSPRPSGHLDFEFILSPKLLADIDDYNKNANVPVLTFLTAQRLLTDAIRDHRHRNADWR